MRTTRLQQTNHNTTDFLDKWLYTVGYLKRMYHGFRLLRRCGMSTEASWRVGWTVIPISPWWQPKRTLSRKSTTLLLKQKSFITAQMSFNFTAKWESAIFIIFFPRLSYNTIHLLTGMYLLLDQQEKLTKDHLYACPDVISNLPKRAKPTKEWPLSISRMTF